MTWRGAANDGRKTIYYEVGATPPQWGGRRGTVKVLLTVALASLAALSIATSAYADSPLRIIQPMNGAEVMAGGALTVIVEVDPGITLVSSVGVMGEQVGFSELLATPPFLFQLSIPQSTAAGVIHLTAVGVIAPGVLKFSAPVSDTS